jgi:predicted CXXCH cytochrome family protein
MGKWEINLFRFLLTCCLLVWYFEGRTDAAQAITDETLSCLECHSQKGPLMKFQNKESLAADLDSSLFKASVHASLGCAGCHPEFSTGNHPKREFKSKEQYKIQSGLVCRQCHTDKSLKAKPVHAALLSKESSAPLCTDCHGAHAITSVAGGKTVAGEKQYCLSCHAHAVTMLMKDNKTVSLKVDASTLNASVHAKLSCFDCHFGFSSTEHPKRSFKGSREFSIASADSCRRCHFDKYSKGLEGIHFSRLSQGNLNAPVCTDCHGAHGITHAKTAKAQVAQTCKKCHQNVYTTYALSVHGKSLLNAQNVDVPVCVDCHEEHSIQDPKTLDSRETVPEMCGTCHANKDLMKKYGLYDGVINSYLEDFHGVTLKLYRQQQATSSATERRPIATCVDCHGVHDISRTKGTETNLFKTRLVKQCQQCHVGATENFPDAWLSHYEPTLKNAPLVYLIKFTYKIFIPFMLIGLVLQILFHVWRYLIYNK